MHYSNTVTPHLSLIFYMKKNIILISLFAIASMGTIIGVVSCKKIDISTSSSSSSSSITIEAISRNIGTEKSITLGTDRYTVGYAQVSSNNQDAYVLKETNGQIVWSKYYDKSPDDARGVAVNIQGDNLVVAFSCTGGNTDYRATTGSFQTSYGSGGGPKIMFLAKINPASGAIQAATFVGCKLDDDKTNTLRNEDNNTSPITFSSNGNIQFRATKAYDKGDGRLTPNIGPDADCKTSGGTWIGIFNLEMKLLQGDCLPL